MESKEGKEKGKKKQTNKTPKQHTTKKSVSKK
jgi:hypothetical protein